VTSNKIPPGQLAAQALANPAPDRLDEMAGLVAELIKAYRRYPTKALRNALVQAMKDLKEGLENE